MTRYLQATPTFFLEPMFRRSPKFLLHLTKEEYDLIVYSMINMKNELTRQGKYTDAVDDALIRFLKAKPKHM